MVHVVEFAGKNYPTARLPHSGADLPHWFHDVPEPKWEFVSSDVVEAGVEGQVEALNDIYIRNLYQDIIDIIPKGSVCDYWKTTEQEKEVARNAPASVVGHGITLHYYLDGLPAIKYYTVSYGRNRYLTGRLPFSGNNNYPWTNSLPEPKWKVVGAEPAKEPLAPVPQPEPTKEELLAVLSERKKENVMPAPANVRKCWVHKNVKVKSVGDKADRDGSLFFAGVLTLLLTPIAILAARSDASSASALIFAMVAVIWCIPRHFHISDTLCIKCGKVTLSYTKRKEKLERKTREKEKLEQQAREQYDRYMELRRKAGATDV